MDETHKTWWWWRSLSAVAALNVVLWTLTALSVDTATPYTAWQLGLSAVFTGVCAFRSVWPRIDLERTTLFDTQISSVIFGRSGATLAEVSFAAQIALALHELGARHDVGWLQDLSPAIVVALAVAQGFCWYGLLTLNHLGHAIEESIWALTFAVVGVCLAVLWPGMQGWESWLVGGGALGCAGYVAFMAIVDVPMYLARWREGVASGEVYLGLQEGFVDAWRRREVTESWSVWQPEVAWLSGYFSAAVWVSLGLVWLPR